MNNIQKEIRILKNDLITSRKINTEKIKILMEESIALSIAKLDELEFTVRCNKQRFKNYREILSNLQNIELSIGFTKHLISSNNITDFNDAMFETIEYITNFEKLIIRLEGKWKME